MTKRLSDEQILDRIIELRQEEPTPTWADIAEAMGSRFGVSITRDACSGRYHRWVAANQKARAVADFEADPRLLENDDIIWIEPQQTVLVISDTHFPFELPGALDFVRRLRDTFKPDLYVHIGDLVDEHYRSFHRTHPDSVSQLEEQQMAYDRIKQWKVEFPKMLGIFGNHDRIPKRQLTEAGVHPSWLKDFSDFWNIHPWRWFFEINMGTHPQDPDLVTFRHGMGTSGKWAAYRYAREQQKNVVSGHVHTAGGVVHDNGRFPLWGMNVGTLMNPRSYAAAYAKEQPKAWVHGCGLIQDYGRVPTFIPYRN